MRKRKIYVASSWRNNQQQEVVAKLRTEGHEVYDFKNPPNNTGFSWKQAEYNMYDKHLYSRHLATDKVSLIGFTSDKDNLNWCDTCVLLLPCGRSAHLEAGYAIGQGKEVFIVLSDEQFEPELMYLLADCVCASIPDLYVALRYGGRYHANLCYGWDSK